MRHFLKYTTPILLFVCCIQTAGIAQRILTLEDCYAAAIDNYPLIRQKDLIAKSSAYTLSNISKGILPQVTLNAQATYQSEVTRINVNIPGLNFEAPSKDQYKVYADIAQPLTELFTVKDQKELTAKNADIQTQSVNVDLFKLRDRINQLYFGILLVDEQLALNRLVEKDLQSGQKRVEAAIKNGVDYKSSLDKIKAELIKNGQRAIELKAQRNSFGDMLGYFTNTTIDDNTKVMKPESILPSTVIHRPELKMFDNKGTSYTIQERIIRNKNIPHVSLFLQAGAGKPSPLNMISNSFSPYYLGGLRLNWSLMNLYTQKNEKSLVHLDRQANQLQKDLFLFNTNLTMRQQNSEITKLNELLQTDDELVDLRTSVKNTSSIQLENGVITTNDYIKEVNAEDQARQSKLLHKIQLIIAQYNLQNTLGN
ncbi:hypothetical protein EMGBS15_09510 [Filimonas sp.]|nr:hypothetical protein EMGBS15_09510 [Filimonas sp.]